MLFFKEQWTIDTRNIGESQNNFGKWKKQAKKRTYSGYIKYYKMKSSQWQQKVDQWLQGGRQRDKSPDYKGAGGNFRGLWICSLSWFREWVHACIRMSKLSRLHTLNICSILNVSSTSVDLGSEGEASCRLEDLRLGMRGGAKSRMLSPSSRSPIGSRSGGLSWLRPYVDLRGRHG